MFVNVTATCNVIHNDHEYFLFLWVNISIFLKIYQFIKNKIVNKNRHQRKEWMKMYLDTLQLPGAQYAFLKTLRNNATVFRGKKETISHISENLHIIKNQTLIFWGEEDKVIPFRISKLALDKIENSSLISVPNAGHSPHADSYEEFNQHVINFLTI